MQTPFLDHAIEQISGRLTARAAKEYEGTDPEAIYETAGQYIYNVGVVAPLAGLTKEESYDIIKPVLKYLSKERTPQNATAVLASLINATDFYATKFYNFKFDQTKMRL